MPVQITSITTDPRQTHKLPVEGFDDCEMTLTWRDTQSSWFADFTFGDVEIFGMRLCSSPNILSQFANRLPFGISVFGEDKQDPITIEAFANGSTTFLMLNAAEVAELGAIYG